MPSLRLRLPLSSSGCCPPASLPPAGDGPVHYWLALLWYLLSSLLCEQAQQCLRSGLFMGKFSPSFFFFSLLWISHRLDCYITLAPSDCLRAFRPSLYPKQCSLCLPVQPPLGGGGRERLGYFSTGNCS